MPYDDLTSRKTILKDMYAGINKKKSKKSKKNKKNKKAK